MPRRRLRICLTGGGTAGHVTPHFALVPEMRRKGWDVFYLGGSGIEQSLVTKAGIDFHTIHTGKLRRYFSFENFVDAFKVFLGIFEALVLLVRLRPDAVFSKGGFVSVPVAVAAWILKIPVVSHESDITPGLATRIIARFARSLLYTFPETSSYLPQDAQLTGTPIRSELFLGDRKEAIELCGFEPEDNAPVLLVMGGSQGAQRLNEALQEVLPDLVVNWRIIHLTGKGKAISFQHPRYKSFEFVGDELKDLLSLADIVVSRAGANSIYELVALTKPMLLIPLESGSRGDQVLNAQSFVQRGWAQVLRESDLSAPAFFAAIADLAASAAFMRANQLSYSGRNASQKILAVIEEIAAKKS